MKIQGNVTRLIPFQLLRITQNKNYKKKKIKIKIGHLKKKNTKNYYNFGYQVI